MNKLREVRVVKRITQFQLCLRTGIHQSRISHLENNLVVPREDECRKIAKALQKAPEEIFPESQTSLGKGKREGENQGAKHGKRSSDGYRKDF